MRLLTLGLLLFFCAGEARTGDALSLSADRAAERAMSKGLAPGLVILVASHGQIVFLRGYGKRSLESGAATTPNTRFEIGSITKQFTAAAVMQLIAANKLSLDDTLNKYIPAYSPGAAVTIRQLLWQTSGIPNYVENPNIVKIASTVQPSVQGVLNLIAGRPLQFVSGTKWAYSNTNYFLLAHIIESVSGDTYQQYIRDHIFKPAGMTDSGFVSDEDRYDNMARGYLTSNGAVVASPTFFSGWAAGAGDIVSTAPDINKWDNALLTGSIVPIRYVEMMRTSGVLASGKATGYGMGWYIDKSKNGAVTIWHNGGTFGFSADNNTYPSTDSTIIVMDNNFSVDAEDIAAQVLNGNQP
ncbi:MAG TPA: serine hydrolase domain-containing protein [Candidatus Tumulicola sp.]|jgi:CubicO group peptidase (beta-lactamase class C family)